MRKKGEGAGRPQRPAPGTLSHEDAELWSRTAHSLEPLRKGKARVAAGVPEPARSRETVRAPANPDAVADTRRPTPHTQAPAPTSRPTTPPPAVLDRRKTRRIATGQVEIEARLDLHGLRQADAHRRLRAFLLDAHGRGLHMVLVITGKGGERERSGSYPFASTPREERGVIRHNVPRWLAEAELNALVVSCTPAHARHGGSGALYIQLRKRRAR